MRTLFNILAALSLLLFLVTAGAWTRSQYVDDAWEFAPLPAPNPPPGWSERMGAPWPGGCQRQESRQGSLTTPPLLRGNRPDDQLSPPRWRQGRLRLGDRRGHQCFDLRPRQHVG